MILYDANKNRCALSRAELGVAPGQVVKAGNGKYYLRSALDEAHNKCELSNVQYDPELDILPECLLRPFVANTTECTILQAPIEGIAVRDVYGDYYDKEALTSWIDQDPSSPLNRQPLTMQYTRELGGVVVSEHQHGASPSFF